MNSAVKSIQAIYPLSPMQEGMLFHSLLEPESDAYVNQLAVTLLGELDEAAFQQAWQYIVDRHEILRTLFIWEHRKRPLQAVRRTVTLPWRLVDLGAVPAADRTRHLDRLLS